MKPYWERFWRSKGDKFGDNSKKSDKTKDLGDIMKEEEEDAKLWKRYWTTIYFFSVKIF